MGVKVSMELLGSSSQLVVQSDGMIHYKSAKKNLERLITLVVEKEMTEVMKVMDFLHLREIHVALV